MKFSREFEEVATLVQQKNNILLASHERPDGDALGSMTAMFCALKTHKDKRIVMFSKDPVPENMKFLPHVDEIVCNIEIGEFVPDLFFGFDYGSFDRLGVDKELIKNATFVTIDHHPFLKQIGDVLIIDDSASSTCEIVYQFLTYAGYDISTPIANAILTGIFTDTGGFAHVNTSVSTLNIAGDLLRRGASLPKLRKHTFSGKSYHTLGVWGRILRNILHDEHIGMAYAVLSHDEFSEMNASLEDFEGIVNIINMPPDVKFSLLLIEHEPGIIKGSFRSEPFKDVDVSRIANALGGGGHKYAAGFEFSGETLKNALKRVKIAAAELV